MKEKNKWDQMHKVLEAMSNVVEQALHQKSSVTRPANHAHTTSVRTSVSASTTLFDAHLECYAFDESQLVLIKSETNQLSDIKDKDKPSSSYSGGPGTEQ